MMSRFIAAFVVACVLAVPAAASAQSGYCASCQGQSHGGSSSSSYYGGGYSADVSYNYYAGPGPDGAYMAAMYPAPVPVPPHVGYTYYTYPPLYPHHYLEAHRLHYSNGERQTFVRYRAGNGQLHHRMMDKMEFNDTTLYSPF